MKIDFTIDNNCIKYTLIDIPDKLSSYLNGNIIIIKYPKEIDLQKCNISNILLPVNSLIFMMCYIFNIDINIDYIDNIFYNSILKILNTFGKIYPNINFGCNLNINKVNHNFLYNKKSAIYFSGGVDAISTLYTHYKEDPIIITVYGINKAVTDNLNFIKNKFNLYNCIIETNIRNIINEKKCIEIFNTKNPTCTFWNRYLQSVIFTTLSAPVCEYYKIGKIYYASTYDYRFNRIQYSSLPEIDNYIKYWDTIVFHDGYEYTRQQKIKRYIEFKKLFDVNYNLHVCFRNENENCCNCYKCIFTLLELMAEGIDVKKYGFKNKPNFDLLYKHINNTNNNVYFDILDTFKNNNIKPPVQLINILKNKKRDYNVLL